MVSRTRGVLYPARLPEFHRLPPAAAARDLVVWFWIPEWSIEPGRSSRQEIVGYPALNLVVEQGVVTLSGATTRASHRDLTGTGWAVGALLRPGAVGALVDDPGMLVDTEQTVDAPDLADAVSAAMATGEGRRERAAAVLSDWLVRRVGPLDESARHANALVEVLMGDGAAGSLEEAALRLAVSTRTLQRLCPPICRRLAGGDDPAAPAPGGRRATATRRGSRSVGARGRGGLRRPRAPDAGLPQRPGDRAAHVSRRGRRGARRRRGPLVSS